MRKPGPNPCSTLPEEDAFSPFLSSLDSSEPDSEPRTLEVSSRTVGIPPAWGSRRQEILGSHHRKCDLNITNWDFTSDNKQFSQQKAGISPAQRRRWSNKKVALRVKSLGSGLLDPFWSGLSSIGQISDYQEKCSYWWNVFALTMMKWFQVRKLISRAKTHVDPNDKPLTWSPDSESFALLHLLIVTMAGSFRCMCILPFLFQATACCYRVSNRFPW